MKKVIMLLFLLFLLGNTVPLLAVMGSGEGEIIDQTEAIISFQQEGHAIVVNVRINDNPKIYHFLFDTGAQTIINTSVAEELGIKPGMRVPTWDSAIVAHIAKVDKIAISNVAVNKMTVVVFDFLEHAGFYDKDGLIGADFMTFFKMTLDYRNHQLVFSTDTTQLAADSNSYLMPITRQPMMGAPMVDCQIDGTLEKYGLIDTGSPYGLIFPLSLIDSLEAAGDLKLLESVGEIAKWPMGKIEGNYLARIDEFNMGGYKLKNVPVIFADIFAVLIGEDILKQFLIKFDFPHKQLSLAPYSDAVFADNLFSSGLRFKKNEEGKFPVTGYWKNSPADSAGVRIGDEVVEINSLPIDSISKSSIDSLLNNNAVRELNLVLKRGDEIMKMHLQKAYMLLPRSEQ